MIMKKIKKILLVIISILSLCNITFSAIVSDNDGSAFVTKAEFDALKEDFKKQIDNYNESIDNKIDGAIAAYLAGRAGAKISQINLYDRYNVKFGAYVDNATTDMVAFRLEGESVWANTCMSDDGDGSGVGSHAFRIRRMMTSTTPLNMDLDNGTKGSSIYNGNLGKYLYVKKGNKGYELKSYWTDYVIYHVFTGSYTNSPYVTLTTACTWAAITPFSDLSNFGTKVSTWGPYISGQNYHNTVHIANVYKDHKKNNIDVYFCNTLPTASRICITDENENKIQNYHQGTIDPNNGNWGWVTGIGSKMTGMQRPTLDKIKYYLKKPVTTNLIPANNFIYNDLSDYLDKKILLTDGAPFVKADQEGKLTFNLKFTCNTTGKTVKFGLNKNTPYENNNTISTNITDINLSSSDFNYNCDTGKTLEVKFDVEKDDIIYLKVDTSSLSYDEGKKTYFVTPEITDLYIAEE